MLCPGCSSVVPNDSKFCKECGRKIINTNPTKTFIEPKSYTPKFLKEQILNTRSSIEGERKNVTVLFADVIGFTPLSEKLDPEDVHQIMDGCFEILMDEVHGHHGTINQFTGDGVMALFGAPLALEDHAQNACRAALSIQDALKKYGNDVKAEYGINFKMRIGLNSGSVVVGSIGDDLRMDYTAIGDTVNLAARMEGIADPGTVVLSPTTYKLIHQNFDLNRLGKVSIKGKNLPIEVYELIKDKVYRTRLGFERKIYSKMVGRNKELNKLELLVAKLINGSGGVANIIGEAGIGKSRLIAELKKRDIVKGVTVIEGRSISIGRNLSFHPIIDLLKNWAMIGEDDSEVVALNKIENSIRRIKAEYVPAITPFIAILMGLKLSGKYKRRVEGIEGEALEKLIVKNIKDLIFDASKISPLIIIMEDLHWSDISSISLIESLFRLVEDARILFINILRPNHPDTSGRILEFTKETIPDKQVKIHIHSLAPEVSHELISNIFDINNLSESLKNKIIQRTGGNPFFLEEVIRSLIDEGLITKKTGRYEVTGTTENIVIPNTVNDVLMDRIDRLEDDTKHLVKMASVIGRNFFRKVLREVAITINDIDTRLANLKNLQIIKERNRLDEIEYLFKHALAQEAAYQSILQQKRQGLHLKVANAIENIFKERLGEFYGILAFHYGRANDDIKAEKYLLKAGEEALNSSASNEALYYYQKALSQYLKRYGEGVDPDKVAIIEENIARSFYNKGQPVDAVKYYERVLSHCGVKPMRYTYWGYTRLVCCIINIILSLTVPLLKFKILPNTEEKKIVDIYRKINEMQIFYDPKGAFINIVKLMSTLTKYNLSKYQIGMSLFVIGGASFAFSGILPSITGKILTLFKNQISDSDFRSKIKYEISAIAYIHLYGRTDFTNQLDIELVEENLNKGEYFYSTIYLSWYGSRSLEKGNFIEVQKIIEYLTKISIEYEYLLAKEWVCQLSIRHMIKRRDLNSALFKADSSITTFSKYRSEYSKSSLFLFHSLRARILALLNDENGADLAGQKSLEFFWDGIKIPYYLITNKMPEFILKIKKLEILVNKSKKINTLKEVENVVNIGKKIIRLSENASFEKTEVLRLMGTYYWLIGKKNRASKWWLRSIEEGERSCSILELSRTYMEIGKRLSEPDSKIKELNRIESNEYLEKARSIFKNLNLQQDLDELDMISHFN